MENMYVAQNRLVDQLKGECKVQADTIQNLSSKYRSVCTDMGQCVPKYRSVCT